MSYHFKLHAVLVSCHLHLLKSNFLPFVLSSVLSFATLCPVTCHCVLLFTHYVLSHTASCHLIPCVLSLTTCDLSLSFTITASNPVSPYDHEVRWEWASLSHLPTGTSSRGSPSQALGFRGSCKKCPPRMRLSGIHCLQAQSFVRSSCWELIDAR